MTTDVDITFINRTRNPVKPSVAVFVQNIAPGPGHSGRPGRSPGVLAWRVMEKIGYLSSSRFVFPSQSTVRGLWGNGYSTGQIEAEPGSRYDIAGNETGIVIAPGGRSIKQNAIEVRNGIKVDNGVRVQLCKSGKPLLEKQVAYDQKATFMIQPEPYLQPVLYWGLAERIREGQWVGEAVFVSDDFFQMDIDGITKATVALTGNTRDGYSFRVEDMV